MIEKNIREKSVFEFINIPLPKIYSLAFYCFTEKFSLDKSFIEVKDNKNLFWGKTVVRIQMESYIHF